MLDTASRLPARKLLDVDVLEGHDADVLDETARPVHVPDPRVAQLELDEGAAAGLPHDLRDLVGQVEAALGLDDVREHRDDVLVLLVELELDVGLVALEVLGAHAEHPTTQCSRFSLTFAAFPMRSRR